MRALARIFVVCLSSSIASACDKGGGTDENAGTEANSGTDEFVEETGTDTDGTMLSGEEFKALCEQQTSSEACDAVPGYTNPDSDSSAWCAWIVEVPAQLDGDTCIFGTPIRECRVVSGNGGDIGCFGGSLGVCSIEDLGWSRMDGDTLLIGRGRICEVPITLMPCSVSPLSGVMGEPECACLCDPNFPL
jgi:hypothetical protein